MIWAFGLIGLSAACLLYALARGMKAWRAHQAWLQHHQDLTPW